MKRITIIMSLLLLIVFSGCTKDKKKMARKAIIGKWDIDKEIKYGVEYQNLGTIKFTRKKSDIVSGYSPTDEIYIAEVKLNDGSEYLIHYELFKGRKDLIFNFYDESGTYTSIDIELMTKDILIYNYVDPFVGYTGQKVYLSK